MWQIIWINLAYQSPIAKWYKENIEWGREFSQTDVEEMLKCDYPDVGGKTIHNILYALFRRDRKPFISEKLLKRVEAMNETGEKSWKIIIHNY